MELVLFHNSHENFTLQTCLVLLSQMTVKHVQAFIILKLLIGVK